MNNLNIDLTGKVVVLSSEFYPGDETDRRFLVTNGFGAMPFLSGAALVGRFLASGIEARAEGWQVEELSDDQVTGV